MNNINDPANLNGKLFGYTVKYYNPINPSLSTGKYNGNVAEVSWRTASDQVLRRYSYQYDGLNRLKKGIYSEPDASVPQNELYNETIAYDMNSNITSLQRNTKGISGTAVLMDNLTYAYTGNRLNTVTDSSGNYDGYPDTSGSIISYDDNGNMKDHADKGILQMEYNFQNLVDKITFDQTYLARNLITGKTVSRNVTTNYTYTADGTKLRKVYKYGGQMFATEVSLTTDYLDGFQYESETASSPFILKFVPTAEGYYNFENNKYIYSYTDHLGNVRVSYTKTATGSAEVLEENNFYPFGMKHEGYNQLAGNPAYNYQFGGKELQKETGWSDFGARMYMSDIGRWGVIDPLAEQYRRFTPYNYAVNNPIRFTDPDGRKLSGSDVEFTDNTIGSNSFWGLSGGRKKIVPFIGGQDFLGQMFDQIDAMAKEQAENGGGGSSRGGDPTPKKKDGPGIITAISNIFKGIFGGNKGAGIKTIVPGAAISRTGIQIGEIAFEGFELSAIGNVLRGFASTGAMTVGAVLYPAMIKEPEFNWTRDLPLDIPITTTGEPRDPNLYLYRNMRSVNGMPMVGEGLDKLGLRDKDVNFLSNSTMITPLFSNGLSVTIGYGNIIPSDVPDTHKKQILFRISASSLVSYGLIGTPVPNTSNPFYGQIRPAIPMNVGTFRTLIQTTAPAWQPVK